MTTEETRSYLREMRRSRGFLLDMHRIMATADLEWTKKYNTFIEATYPEQRLLDRKTKELLQVVTLAALRADVEHIQVHVRLALQEGASAQEILESLQSVFAPMGALAFRGGLLAWAAETGLEPIDVEEPKP